jgi:hypothetical protein
MRLVLPPPVGARLDPVAVAPGVTLRIHPAEPLPLDLEAWYARAIAGSTVQSRGRGRTETGWSVTLIRVAEPAALFGFFELYDRGVVVAATADDEGALDAAIADVRRLLLAGDIDREQREVVALAQIWGDE